MSQPAYPAHGISRRDLLRRGSTLALSLAAASAGKAVLAPRAAASSSPTPEEYGADPTGQTDSTQALTNAICAVAGTGNALLLTGTYLISSICLNISGVILQGQPGATIVSSLPKLTNDPVLWLQGGDLHVLDITFDYLVPQNIDVDGANIYVNGSNASTVRLGVSEGAFVSNLSVQRCTISNSRNTSIFMAGASNVSVIDNRCYEQGQGIFLTDIVSGGLVSGNIVDRAVDDLVAVVSDGSLPQRSQGVVIDGNTLTRGYSQGIDLTGTNGCQVTNNVIDTTWNPGILVYQYTGVGPTGSDLNVAVQQNQIRNAGTYYGKGQYKTAPAASGNGIDIEGQSSITLSSNMISGTVVNGIQVNGVTGVNIESNQVTNSGGTGINISAAGQETTDVLVDSNIVQMANGGIVCMGNESFAIRDLQVTNNVISSYRNGGSGAYRGLFFGYCDPITIGGNTIINDTDGDETVMEYPSGSSTVLIAGSGSSTVSTGSPTGTSTVSASSPTGTAAGSSPSSSATNPSGGASNRPAPSVPPRGKRPTKTKRREAKLDVPESGRAVRVPESGAVIYLDGGKVSRILVNGKAIRQHQGVVHVPSHGTVKLVYKRRPRWKVYYPRASRPVGRR